MSSLKQRRSRAADPATHNSPSAGSMGVGLPERGIQITEVALRFIATDLALGLGVGSPLGSETSLPMGFGFIFLSIDGAGGLQEDHLCSSYFCRWHGGRLHCSRLTQASRRGQTECTPLEITFDHLQKTYCSSVYF